MGFGAPVSGGAAWNGTPSQPTRALDTIYQNDGSSWRFVAVTIYLTAEEANEAWCSAYIGEASPPDMEVVKSRVVRIEIPPDVGAHSQDDVLCFIVPSGYYYLLDATVGVVLQLWTEWDA